MITIMDISVTKEKRKLLSDYGSEKPFWDFCIRTFQKIKNIKR